jgi:hypothetical protein
MGLKIDPLPKLELRTLTDPDTWSHFDCKTKPGPEATGLYPLQDKYPDYQFQAPYSSPNGAFPDMHASYGGPQDKGDPGPLPFPLGAKQASNPAR